MSHKGPIIESIYDTEIFMEKRRRINLKDVFVYDHNGIEPIVVYVAQAEAPDPDGTYRHGYAFYNVKNGAMVQPGSLLQDILFRRMPKISRMTDLDKDFPNDPELKYRIDMLLDSLVEKHHWTSAEVADYNVYLDKMQALRPEPVQALYEFFRDHCPSPRYY